MDKIKILDVKINIVSKAQVLDKIKDLLNSDEPADSAGKQLITTNPEFIVAAQKDEEFKNIINNSWLSVADGYGIRLAAKYLDIVGTGHCHVLKKFLIGMKIAWWGIIKNDKKLDVVKEIITGTDLVSEICHHLAVIPAKAGIPWRIFLLGGYGDVPQLAAEKLKQQFNNLTIYYSVFEDEDIIKKINDAKANILFVALNHPRAQKWIDKNLSKMPSVKLVMGVGGAFDYISGKIKRAPKSWQRSFEWLFRLFVQPKRWKRILVAWPRFPWKIFTNSINKKQLIINKKIIYGALAVSYIIEENKIKFLILKHKDGFWAFPGGVKEEDDMDLKETIQREIREEIGLEKDEYKLFETGIINKFKYSIEKRTRTGENGITKFFLAELRNKEVKTLHNITKIKWCNKDEILNLISLKDIKEKFLETIKYIK